jgi:hypothetical protein
MRLRSRIGLFRTVHSSSLCCACAVDRIADIFFIVFDDEILVAVKKTGQDWLATMMTPLR